MNYDLRNASFEEFLDFLFDHPVAAQHREENWGKKETQHEKEWYFGLGFPSKPRVLHDPARTAGFYITMLTHPQTLLERYSRDQIVQGFGFLVGVLASGNAAGLGRLLTEPAVAIEKRLAVVEALYHLHDRLFAVEDLKNSAGGLWFNLGMAVSLFRDSEILSSSDGVELAQITGGLFNVLCRLLEHPEAKLVDAAITGMEGIEHWKTPAALRTCLETRDDLSAECRERAQAAIKSFDLKLRGHKWPIYH